MYTGRFAFHIEFNFELECLKLFDTHCSKKMPVKVVHPNLQHYLMPVETLEQNTWNGVDLVEHMDRLMLSGDPSEKETEQITQLWQSGLFNAHYDIQRYVTGYCFMCK